MGDDTLPVIRGSTLSLGGRIWTLLTKLYFCWLSGFPQAVPLVLD